MKIIKYFFEFIVIVTFFLFFKILGLRLSSFIGGKIGKFLGPFFRSKKIISSNIRRALPNSSSDEIKKISDTMWSNYGKILSEYMFLKKLRSSKNVTIEGKDILDQIIKNDKPVIFVSGHFSSFELMAMMIERSGVKLAALYRPLNNFFLNFVMEHLRKKYICKNQIKKGIKGLKELLTFFKSGHSIALMIDQRVTEGIRSKFFNDEAFTTTVPAQFAQKFNCEIVTVYIERKNSSDFKIKINKPLKFKKDDGIEEITRTLNACLEEMILRNPGQWIWSHNRWKK